METGKPLAESVVYLRFSTMSYTPAGHVYSYADAIEVLSNKNGEFYVPAQWLVSFKPFSTWPERHSLVIFKPGYGVYPDHREAKPRLGYLPEKEYVVLWLPKLKSAEEKRKNLGHMSSGSRVPMYKYKNMRRLENIERVNLGLKPLRLKPKNRISPDKAQKKCF